MVIVIVGDSVYKTLWVSLTVAFWRDYKTHQNAFLSSLCSLV